MDKFRSARERKRREVSQRQAPRRTRPDPEEDQIHIEDLTDTSIASVVYEAREAQHSEENVAVEVHYPRWVYHLGSLTFLLYAGLYVNDGFLLYWTFVPGFYREVYVLLQYAYYASQDDMPGIFSPVNLLDTPKLLRYLAAFARLAVGQHYAPNGRTFRYIDGLVRLSFRSRPWTAWAGYRILRAAVLPGEYLEDGKIIGLVAPALAWVFFHIVGQSNAFVASQLPPSYLWQLALSFYRLRHSGLNAYKHQVPPAIAVMQLALLLDMPRLAWQATSSYRLVILPPQIRRTTRAGYRGIRGRL